MSLDRIHGEVERRAGSWPRIWAMVMRYWYLLRGSWPRLVEMLYWPTLNVLLWGLISRFFQGNSSYVAQGIGVLIGAVMLWEVLFRSQMGIALCFMEEMWSRNLGHMFVSPLHPLEWLAAMIISSLIRVVIGMAPAVGVSILLYHYSIFTMGLPLVAFVAALTVMGWWISLVITSMILRYGLGAESLVWMGMFALEPVSAVFYPVASMPAWLQPVAWAMPSAQVFEGMRTVLFQHRFDWHLFATAMGLNGLYSLGAIALFRAAFHSARKRGALLNVGE